MLVSFIPFDQVMDTPGLLDRPAEERNEMERLTFASLAHLPTGTLTNILDFVSLCILPLGFCFS